LHGQHDSEIDGAGIEYETNKRVEELADVNFARRDVIRGERGRHLNWVQHGDVDYQRGEVWRADKSGDRWGDYVGGKGRRDCAKSCADNDGYGQVDYVSTQNKVSETLEHFVLQLLEIKAYLIGLARVGFSRGLPHGTRERLAGEMVARA
jgi:hypothetical protein